MTTSGVPAAVEDLTPAWLTASLRAGGVLRAASVTSVDASLLSEGVGFIGQVVRLTLTYDRAASGDPASVIAKLPTLDEGGRTIGAMYGMYERELLFYRDLGDEIPVRTPRCYYSDSDATAVRYVLLLEDLASFGALGDQVRACTLEEATAAIETLARFHAWSWEHPRLTSTPWLQLGIDIVEGSLTQLYPTAWPRTIELFGDQMTPAIRDAIPTLGERGMLLMDRFRGGPFTIIHGDYRADNLLFAPGGEIAVLDWQSPNKSFAAYDIAYFISGSISKDTMRQHGERLLRAYYDRLVDGGVKGYAYGRFREDCVASLLAYLAIFVVSGGTLDTANERGFELFRLIFERLAAAITDTDALSMLR